MTGLIGILLFVVVLMAVDMVEQVLPAAQATATDLEADLAELTAARDDLQQHVYNLTDQLNIVTAQSDREIEEDIHRLHQRLLAVVDLLPELDEQAARQQAEVADAEADLAEAERISLQAAEDLEELDDEGQAPGPAVMYILDESIGKQPWLVEITANRIRVAATDGSSFQLAFTSASGAQRMAELTGWAATLDSDENYFVLLIKPSGAEDAETIEKRLRGRGYWTGKDLLPEDWEPFGG